MYMDKALVWWLSKKQPIIDTYMLRAEYVDMKTGIEILRGLMYKLRMVGIPLSGPLLICGDNMSVIHNTQKNIIHCKIGAVQYVTMQSEIQLRWENH